MIKYKKKNNFSPYESNITPLSTVVRVSEHLLHVPHLLSSIPSHQVKLPGYHQEVVMVQAVVNIGTVGSGKDPPGCQDSPSTVMTTKACKLNNIISSSLARVTSAYLQGDCVGKLARRSLLNTKSW